MRVFRCSRTPNDDGSEMTFDEGVCTEGEEGEEGQPAMTISKRSNMSLITERKSR
jgi:hypothetical protein